MFAKYTLRQTLCFVLLVYSLFGGVSYALPVLEKAAGLPCAELLSDLRTHGEESLFDNIKEVFAGLIGRLSEGLLQELYTGESLFFISARVGSDRYLALDGLKVLSKFVKENVRDEGDRKKLEKELRGILADRLSGHVKEERERRRAKRGLSVGLSRKIKVPGFHHGVFSKDSKSVLAVSRDFSDKVTIRKWDVRTGKKKSKRGVSYDAMSGSVARDISPPLISPDGRRKLVFMGNSEGRNHINALVRLALVNRRSGRALHKLKENSFGREAFQFWFGRPAKER